jgi:hypothetical protein
MWIHEIDTPITDKGHIDNNTWFGCGFHVPSVMDSIPEDEWCTCEPKVKKDGKEYPPMKKNILRLLLGW